MQARNEMVLLRRRARAAGHVWSTTTLSSNHIAIVVQRAARVTLAMAATIVRVRQTVRLRQTLITVFAGDQVLARALAGVHVAARVVARAENIARAQLTAIDVVRYQIPVAFLAHVALASAHIRLAVT